MQLEEKQVATDRAGHEISDDYERETSVIEQVLAAAVKRREEKSRRQGQKHYGGQVSFFSHVFIIFLCISYIFSFIYSLVHVSSPCMGILQPHNMTSSQFQLDTGVTQLVEHCAIFAEVMGLTPVKSGIF